MNRKSIHSAAAPGLVFLIAMLLHLAQSLAFSLLIQKGIDVAVEIRLIFSELTIIVPAIIYIIIAKPAFGSDLGFSPIKPGTFFMCIVLTVPVTFIASFFNTLSQLFASNAMAQMSDELLTGSNLSVLIIGGLIGPLCEEFVFRSVLFYGYEKIAGPLRAALMTAVLFALAHMNINQAFYAVVLGFIFATVNKAAGSIWPSVIIHVCINVYNIGLIMIMSFVSGRLGITEDFAASAEAARQTDYLYTLIGVTLVFAIIGVLAAIPCIVFISKHEGNLDSLRGMFTKKHGKGRMISVPLILAVVLVLFIMFGAKPLLQLLKGGA